MPLIQGKSLAFWIFLAVSIAFAMRIAARAPHTIDIRFVMLLVNAVLFFSIFAGRNLALGNQQILWLMVAGAVASIIGTNYLLRPSNSFDLWLLAVMAANAGRTMECEACALPVAEP